MRRHRFRAVRHPRPAGFPRRDRRRPGMYCYESRGTDVDHFVPIARDPMLTFEWTNHILPCLASRIGCLP